jgi:hypothetical protein
VKSTRLMEHPEEVEVLVATDENLVYQVTRGPVGKPGEPELEFNVPTEMGRILSNLEPLVESGELATGMVNATGVTPEVYGLDDVWYITRLKTYLTPRSRFNRNFVTNGHVYVCDFVTGVISVVDRQDAARGIMSERGEVAERDADKVGTRIAKTVVRDVGYAGQLAPELLDEFKNDAQEITTNASAKVAERLALAAGSV